MVMKIMKGVYEPFPAHYSSDLGHLLKSLVQVEPDARPDMKTIISMPFLQEAIIEAQLSVGRLSLID